MANQHMSVLAGVDLGSGIDYSSMVNGAGPPDNTSGDPLGSMYMDTVGGTMYVKSGTTEWSEIMAAGSPIDTITEMLIRVLTRTAVVEKDRLPAVAKEIAESYVRKDHDEEDRIVLEEYLGIGNLLEDLY